MEFVDTTSNDVLCELNLRVSKKDLDSAGMSITKFITYMMAKSKLRSLVKSKYGYTRPTHKLFRGRYTIVFPKITYGEGEEFLTTLRGLKKVDSTFKCLREAVYERPAEEVV